MTPQEADAYVSAAGAYVHIPFCSAVCPYCDFAVVAGKDHLARRYIDCLVAEIDRSRPWRPLDAVYLGGGTPSHLDPGMLGEVLDALAHRHGIAVDAEVSIEANPEDFDDEKAKRLRGIGFNRVSFGAQSLDGGVLAALGRRHVPHQVGSAVSAARSAGFENVSIDLIFGAESESEASWECTVRGAAAMATEHVSCYALTVEPGTPLARAVRAGAAAPDPDVQADRYQQADALLTEAGLERYEVSNWARPGYECRYNLIVWAQGEYLAFGNGAHGHREGRRYRNVRRLQTYLDRVESRRSARAGDEPIDGWDVELDRVFVGLRRRVGVAAGAGSDALLASDEGRALVSLGIVADTGGRLTVRQPLLTDAVHRAVLGQGPPIVLGDADA